MKCNHTRKRKPVRPNQNGGDVFKDKCPHLGLTVSIRETDHIPVIQAGWTRYFTYQMYITDKESVSSESPLMNYVLVSVQLNENIKILGYRSSFICTI